MASSLSGCWILCLFSVTCVADTKASAAEKGLRANLFGSYNKLALPVRNTSDTLLVHFGLFIEQIIDVDERNQVFTSKVWVRQVWHDHSLEWKPELYEGIGSIKVPSESIWVPDILIYNNANGTYDMPTIPWASVNHTGHVTWFPPALYKTACRIDVRYFPFDEQSCTLKFGSWAYDGGKIDLLPSNDSAEQRDYWGNGEWKLLNSPCIRNAKKYPCCNETYVDVTCTFVLRRMALYYFAYVLLPCGLISFNTVLVFYLPPDINEKMSLCTMVLLSMALFLLLVTQRIPPNSSSFPLIIKYLLFTMIIVSSSIILTILILNIRHRSPRTHTMPRWVRKLFIEILPMFLSMQRPERYSKRYRHLGISLAGDAVNNNNIDVKKIIMESHGNRITVRMRTETEDSLDEFEDTGSATTLVEEHESSIFQEGIHKVVDTVDLTDAMVAHKAIEEFMYLASIYTCDEDLKLEQEDWKYVATVIDRMFLILYLCVVLIGTLIILFEAPLATVFFKSLLISSEERDILQATEVISVVTNV